MDILKLVDMQLESD